jgi:glycosyltransferase involved in cell wall biosynthesis
VSGQDWPSVSVVIPTYNRSDVVERTLRCLAAQDYPADKLEVLVVDNSSDDTPQMTRRVAAEVDITIRLLERPERMPATKRNIGVREATGELVLFMNDDLWLVPEAVREHAVAHRARGDQPVAVLGRTIQSPQMEQTPFIEAYEPFAYFELGREPRRDLRWWYCWSMNLSLPREVMLARNLVFHTDWREIGSEDVELGWRWTQAGYPLDYAPAAWGEHFHPHSLDSASRLQASIGRGVRDLEALVDDPDLLERWGIFDWRNSPRSVARSLIRMVLFNDVTVPPVTRWLNGRTSNNAASRWLWWKVLLHHTNKGYRATSPRRPVPTPTLPVAESTAEAASSGVRGPA